MKLVRRPETPQGATLCASPGRVSSTTAGPGMAKYRADQVSLYLSSAGVAELADAVALGATGRKSLEVQILSPAPKIEGCPPSLSIRSKEHTLLSLAPISPLAGE